MGFPKLQDDEFAFVRFCMKMMCFWPDGNPRWWKKIVQISYWPVPSAQALPFMLWFTFTEAFDYGTETVIQAASDDLAIVTLVLRGIIIVRHTQDVYELSKMVVNAFHKFEKNHTVVKVKRSPIVWLPSIAFGLVCCFSTAMCAKGILGPPEKRITSVQVHSYVRKTDWLYYSVMGTFTCGHWHVVVYNTVADGLIISTATAMQGRAETLKNILKDLGKVKDKEQVDKELNQIVEYHNLICKLHAEIHRITNWPLLIQVFFLVISIGSPVFLLVYGVVGVMKFFFLASYLIWVTSTLAVYCILCDDATNACMSIGQAAYAAYYPEMDPKVAQKLVLIMIVRRTYSLYSALMNLK